MDDITILEVIREGPPGTGITEAELTQIQADLTTLRNTTWRGTPKLRLRSLPTPTDGASTTLTNLPGMAFVSIPGLSSSTAHLIEITGRVRVTSPADVIVSVGATLGSVETAELTPTPTGAGTHWVSCSGIWVYSGISNVTAYLSYQCSDAETVTFEEAHIEVRVTPRSEP
jgi:hypothetical protein